MNSPRHDRWYRSGLWCAVTIAYSPLIVGYFGLLANGLTYPGQVGTLCPPHQNHSISSKWLGAWNYLFGTFLSLYIPYRKVQFHQPALMYVAMATFQLFGLFLKIQISNVLQVFPPERNFLWDNLLCFGHSNTVIGLIKANIRTVTMETLRKINFPKYGHRH